MAPKPYTSRISGSYDLQWDDFEWTTNKVIASFDTTYCTDFFPGQSDCYIRVSTPKHLSHATVIFDTDHLRYTGELRFKGEVTRQMICDKLDGIQVWAEFVTWKQYSGY